MNYETVRLKKIAENVIGTDVLDVGYAAMPNPYISHCNCTGYDLVVPERHSGYSRQIQGDVHTIVKKLDGQRFDTIILGEIIEHLTNPYAVLDDLHALLKNEKTLIISTPNPLGFPVYFCELFGLKRYYYDSDHKYYFLPRWAERLIQSSDYQVEKVVPVGLWTPIHPLPCPKVFSYQLIYVCKSIRSEK